MSHLLKKSSMENFIFCAVIIYFSFSKDSEYLLSLCNVRLTVSLNISKSWGSIMRNETKKMWKQPKSIQHFRLVKEIVVAIPMVAGIIPSTFLLPVTGSRNSNVFWIEFWNSIISSKNLWSLKNVSLHAFTTKKCAIFK